MHRGATLVSRTPRIGKWPSCRQRVLHTLKGYRLAEVSRGVHCQHEQHAEVTAHEVAGRRRSMGARDTQGNTHVSRAARRGPSHAHPNVCEHGHGHEHEHETPTHELRHTNTTRETHDARHTQCHTHSLPITYPLCSWEPIGVTSTSDAGISASRLELSL